MILLSSVDVEPTPIRAYDLKIIFSPRFLTMLIVLLVLFPSIIAETSSSLSSLVNVFSSLSLTTVLTDFVKVSFQDHVIVVLLSLSGSVALTSTPTIFSSVEGVSPVLILPSKGFFIYSSTGKSHKSRTRAPQ